MQKNFVVFATIKNQFSKDFIKENIDFLPEFVKTQNYFKQRQGPGTHPSSVTLKFNFCKNRIVDLRGQSQENINLWKCISNKQSFLYMR
jgi:hypothetical protein